MVGTAGVRADNSSSATAARDKEPLPGLGDFWAAGTFGLTFGSDRDRDQRPSLDRGQYMVGLVYCQIGETNNLDGRSLLVNWSHHYSPHYRTKK